MEVSSFGNNAGIGKTGVHLQYHKTPEYATLYKYQKEEIHEWRLKKPNSKGRTKGRENKRPNRNKSIAAAANKQVEKTLSEAIKDAEAETSPNYPNEDQAREYIISLLKDTKAETTPVKPILKKVTLKSIIGKVNMYPKWNNP